MSSQALKFGSLSNYKLMNIRFILRAAFATFGAYFCMYAFRKPFAVATFSDIQYWGIDYKILLIIAQVIGYIASKFLGIKVISEMKSNKRTFYLITFILIAELALLGFALTPPPYNITFLFLNGLPLGMIWGIVFSYIEGRKATEILGVILCSSFIISSGVVKSIGKYTLDTLEVSEFWMPFITGLFFVFPLFFFSYLLEKIPVASKKDINARSKRRPLQKKERLQLFKTLLIPLTSIVIFYVFITGVRDFRDNYAREIWGSLGYANSSSIFSFSEIPIALTVLFLMIMIGLVPKNYKAFSYYHIAIFSGGILIALSTLSFQLNFINPVAWMIISGFGLYIGYIPFQGLFFDRMIATFKIDGNVGFLIYIADAFGYLGSILILLYKNFGEKKVSYLSFFIALLYIIAILCVVVTSISFFFFREKYKQLNNES